MTRPAPPAQRVRALAGEQPKPPSWYHVGPVQNTTTDSSGSDGAAATAADVYVYDTIGGWMGISADDFVRDVASLEVDAITLHLNTPGGDVFEAMAMANVLRAHKASVTVVVDGLAASAGSVLAMAGDEVVMGIGSQMMVHDAWSVCVGSAADMAKTAEMLTSTSDSISSAYASRAGGTAADWRAVMVAESWYTAEEAVQAGLADRVGDADEKRTATGQQVVPGGSGGYWDMWDSYRSQDRFDLSVFAHAGRGHAPTPTYPASAGAKAAAGSAHPTEESMADTLSDGLRQKLGLPADADEATILSALDETLAEHADPDPVVPEGQVLIPAAALADLQAAAATTRTLAENQRTRERAEVLDSFRDRYAPASRAAWEKQYDIDPEGTKAYLKDAPVLVPLSEIGHDGESVAVDESAADAFAVIFGLPTGSLRA